MRSKAKSVHDTTDPLWFLCANPIRDAGPILFGVGSSATILLQSAPQGWRASCWPTITGRWADARATDPWQG